jgi:hypothetical protein
LTVQPRPSLVRALLPCPARLLAQGPTARRRRPWARRAALVATGALLGLAAPMPARASLPSEGQCPTLGPVPGGHGMDAMPVPLHPGQSVGAGDLLRIRDLLPPELWRFRDTFFYEGMRLEIGPCFRRYPTGKWFEEATRKFAGHSRLDREGDLLGHQAGLPFLPETIDPKDPMAAMKWAWDLEMRYRGAGPFGSFRLLDLPDKLGSPETYIGSFFLLATSNRADLPQSDYRVPDAPKRLWVAGGRFDEPFNARFLAWRQMRPLSTLDRFAEPDDTFVYVPTMRKVRRAASAWVDGLYTPTYLVSGDAGGGPIPFGSTQYGPAGSIQPTAGLSIAATENLRRGFVGMAIRPNAYAWRFVAERPVLAPLNAVVPGWPADPERNYGPSGISVASDRWDVRQAIVIEGRARKVVNDVGYVRMWIDEQTLQPLYMITERPNRLLIDVGILVHRFSGDVENYPEWPGGGAPNAFDPVAAVFFAVANGGSGWRRESYDVVSVPDPARMRSMTTTEDLDRKGH